jgi:hypothetical protein
MRNLRLKAVASVVADYFHQWWRLQVRRRRPNDGGRYPKAAGGHRTHGVGCRRHSSLKENIFSGNRLHHTWKTGLFPLALTEPYRVRCRCGSRVRLPELCRSDCSFPRLVGYLLNEQLQGKLLSAYKIIQAYPGVPGLMA